MRARSVTGIGLALALGCSQSATSGDEGQGPPDADPVATGPACAEGSKDPVLHFHGRACPWELVSVGSEVRLRSLDLDPQPAFAGRLPAVCLQQHCDLEGVESHLGPLLLAVLRSPDSEMPAGTFLGAKVGDRLRFVDLWEGAGDHVVSDGTRLGPTHALGPHDCAGELALLVVERLPGADAVEAPPALVARQGRMTADGEDGVALRSVGGKRCKPIAALALP